MGYDRGDSFLFDFEPNGIPFGSEKRKENCHYDHIPFNVEGNRNIVFSVYAALWDLRICSEEWGALREKVNIISTLHIEYIVRLHTIQKNEI